MNIHEARPPFVEFKKIAKHDPIRSEEVGYRVTKDVNMAFIMQPGSRDQVERIAEDWLASIKRKVLDNAPDQYPQPWVDAFHQKFESWKTGHDAPVIGTSVKEWPLLSPAQVENFIAARILTVEDVAAMTEEAMGRVGMGARELKEKAIKWLTTKETAESAIKENEELKAMVARLMERVEELEKPKRGRPAKEE